MTVGQFHAGLRCHDVHNGLRNVDSNSSSVDPLYDTRIVGMSASLASLVRGQDVVPDASALRAIATEQLDIPAFAFKEVVETLEAVGFVSDVQIANGKVASFTETIPYHEQLFDRLGSAWRGKGPNQLEEEMVAVIDRLAQSPLPAEELESKLGLDHGDVPRLLEIGKAAELIKGVKLLDGEVLYSPFYGFENPDVLGDLLTSHGSGLFGEELEKLKAHQGLPLSEASYPALSDAIGRGFIMAPSVLTPDGVEQPFAALPYSSDRELFTTRKTVLDKALAILACVRCGEHFGGATNTRSPARVLTALLDSGRNHTLAPHSSHKRQYQLLYRMQIVDFIPSGNWVMPKLIATQDNLEAVRIARDLIQFGEPIEDRAGDADAGLLLTSRSPYSAPMQTLHKRRATLNLSDSQYQAMMDAAMGRAEL